jgi:hypothetical protein
VGVRATAASAARARAERDPAARDLAARGSRGATTDRDHAVTTGRGRATIAPDRATTPTDLAVSGHLSAVAGSVSATMIRGRPAAAHHSAAGARSARRRAADVAEASGAIDRRVAANGGPIAHRPTTTAATEATEATGRGGRSVVAEVIVPTARDLSDPASIATRRRPPADRAIAAGAAPLTVGGPAVRGRAGSPTPARAATGPRGVPRARGLSPIATATPAGASRRPTGTSFDPGRHVPVTTTTAPRARQPSTSRPRISSAPTTRSSPAGGPSRRPLPPVARPADSSSSRSVARPSNGSFCTPRTCGSQSSRSRAARSPH